MTWMVVAQRSCGVNTWRTVCLDQIYIPWWTMYRWGSNRNNNWNLWHWITLWSACRALQQQPPSTNLLLLINAQFECGEEAEETTTKSKVTPEERDSAPEREREVYTFWSRTIGGEREKEMRNKKTKSFSTTGGGELRAITTRWGVLPPCCNTTDGPIPSAETISRRVLLTCGKQRDLSWMGAGRCRGGISGWVGNGGDAEGRGEGGEMGGLDLQKTFCHKSL